MSSSNIINFCLGIQDKNLTFLENNFEIRTIKNRNIKVFHALVTQKHCNCPHCCSINVVKNGTKPSLIKIIPIQEYETYIQVHRQRFKCKACGKTFSAKSNFVMQRARISYSLKLAVAQKLKFKISLKDIAKEYNISIATVQRIMDKFYQIKKKELISLPENICIDEFKSTADADGAMSCIFANADTKKAIEILENRKRDSLIEYFARYSLEERNKVKTICMDIYAPYMSLAAKMFPKAKIILDRFHIINLINRALNKTRIRVMNSLENSTLKKMLKAEWQLFLKDSNNLCSTRYYYSRLKGMYSSLEKVEYMLKNTDGITEEYDIYQILQFALKNNNFNLFENTVNKALKAKEKISKNMIVSLRTLKKYMNYIKNTMDISITNGVIEGINNKIKVIKRIAFGYRNFDNLKKRFFIINGILNLQVN
ncbi:MAG: ISL3 family transposase [Fusobacterium gastrosuis]|uniref:ISL3 family transposase n=1 Tax=Fusobacterium gastrosuis TaxID=1755100 RepID=UPI002A8E4F8E|nr:ISL3 family transposase [Fusobacterium gastrosuis]